MTMRLKRLFKGSKKVPKPLIEDAELAKDYSIKCDTDDSASSIVERTKIHVTTTTEEEGLEEIASPEEHVVAVEKREPSEQPKDSLNAPRMLCGNIEPEGVQNDQDSVDPARVAPKPLKRNFVTTECIECVFDGEEKPQVENPRHTKKESILSAKNVSEAPHGDYCTCSPHRLPPLNTKLWPQAPLLFRPHPKSGTKIVGIRKDNAADYLWTPKDTTPWWRVLQQEWGQPPSGPDLHPCCEYCAIIPINNGNEAEGEALVADFETELFQGSLLLRLRHTDGTTAMKSDDTQGFFAGVPFRYQAVIRGQFKVDVPFTELITGTHLERPCGKLPPRWVIWSALKVIHFFAPQLKSKTDTPRPYTLSPLGSTARTVTVDAEPSGLVAIDRTEPTAPEKSLTGKAYPVTDDLERARARKRHFDKLYIAKSQTPRTDPTKTFTFEFLQHLFDYQKFSIDLGSFQVNIKDLLGGQPLQLMAAHEDKLLWWFEIWNTCLLEEAENHTQTS